MFTGFHCTFSSCSQTGAARGESGVTHIKAGGSPEVSGIRRRLLRSAAFAHVHAITIVNEALQGANRNWLIDLAAAAGRFTWRAAHPAARRGERIRLARDQVGAFIIALGDG